MSQSHVSIVSILLLSLGIACASQETNILQRLVSRRVGEGFKGRGLYKQIFVPNTRTYDRALWLGGAFGYYGPISDRNRVNFNDICTWEGFTKQIQRPELNSSEISHFWNSSYCPNYFCTPGTPVYHFFDINYTSPWRTTSQFSQIDILLFTTCLHCSELWNSSFTTIVSDNTMCINRNESHDDPASHLELVQSFSDRADQSVGFLVGQFHPQYWGWVWYMHQDDAYMDQLYMNVSYTSRMFFLFAYPTVLLLLLILLMIVVCIFNTVPCLCSFRDKWREVASMQSAIQSPRWSYLKVVFSMRNQGHVALLCSIVHMIIYVFAAVVTTNTSLTIDTIFLLNFVDMYVLVSISILSIYRSNPDNMMQRRPMHWLLRYTTKFIHLLESFPSFC
jgi:hypothetical protein